MVKSRKFIVRAALTLALIVSSGLSGAIANDGSPFGGDFGDNSLGAAQQLAAKNATENKTASARADEVKKRLDQNPGDAAASRELQRINRGIEERSHRTYGDADRFSGDLKMQRLATAVADAARDWPRMQDYSDRWASLVAPGSADWAKAVKTGGLAAHKAGDFEKAAAYAAQVLERFPRDTEAMALYQMSKGRVRAGAGGTSALAASAPAAAPPTSASAPAPPAAEPSPASGRTALRVRELQRYVAEADKYLKLGDREGALRAARGVEGIDPATGYQMQARILAAFKDFSRALALLGKAIEALAGRPDRRALAYAQRAGILNDKDNPGRDPRAALEDAEAALALEPGSARALLERGKAKLALGDPSADADLRAAIDRDPRLQATLGDFLGAGDPRAVPGSSRRGGGGWTLLAGAAGALLALGAGYLVFFAKDGARTRGLSESIAPTAIEPAMPESLENGRYVIGRLLGEGGMGAVHEAEDTQLGRLVAVKSLHKDLRTRERECRRFVGEAKAVAALQHPNIVQVFTVVEERSSTYIVYERIEGRTLEDAIRSGERGLEPRLALDYARQIASALDYAHAAKVIHRDLKPANVMVTKVDGKDWLKVMDFGISRQIGGSRATTTSTIVGTPAYMAPEQEDGVVTKQSDQFSLGVTAYEMLTRRPPFGASAWAEKREKTFMRPSKAAPGLPPEIDAVFERALDPDPGKRYALCTEFCRALEDAFDARPTPA